jgi:uncharacterized protein (TIGR02757 family)
MLTESAVELLKTKYIQFNNFDFIELDPISIPHKFSKKQDIEISGLFAAILAWGQRKTIISKLEELMHKMGNSPFDFIMNHTYNDLKSLAGFKHRTFNDTDLFYLIEFLKTHYSKFDSLENAFYPKESNFEMKQMLIAFNSYVFSLEDYPHRTRKHISTPAKNSACKRLNMYLRWMVRSDEKNVDFGIWDTIKPSHLICPCDVHVEKSARILGLTQRPKADWSMAVEITDNLKSIDADDPVKFDFALFGLGIEKYFDAIE